MGRRAGSRNTGYFYRNGRGWCTTIDGRMVALRDADGHTIKLKTAPVAELKAAYRKIIAEPAEPVNAQVTNCPTVEKVCEAYLAKALSDGASKTHNDRAHTLWDFCTGLPPRFRGKKEDAKTGDRIHRGYGQLAVNQLLPLHVDQWLASHKEWNGGKRTRVQALKRALNYGVESGLISSSPLKGYKVPRPIPRVTYITPEQEEALSKATNAAFAVAVKVCIRTGARPGAEFAKLTAKHVKDHGDRMEFVFAASENKTGKQTRKPRVIRITDKEIIEIVRQQVKQYPQGVIFRNTKGSPWLRKNLELSFRKAKERLLKADIELDADACMYSCRHTYAKRILQGYWTGKQTNIETLARLMGNSPQVCREHYLLWTSTYEEPLWESA